ncbi:response regulator transcription factor [Longispora sp. NPDC051575]|uniref:response regulator transcription factor n=1 Tax=Longispora sp. NPDC051575 TaxID=3154943 RepID=UPI003438132F
MIRLVVVDDQELVRAGFRVILSAQDDMEVVGEAGDGAEALRLLRDVVADVVVMDIRMPVMDGVAATRVLCARPEGPRVLVLTTFDTDEDAFAALQAGASGFLLKNVPSAELLAAIRIVASGDAVVAPRITRRLLERFAGQFVAAPSDPAAFPPGSGSEGGPDDTGPVAVATIGATGAARLAALTDRERQVLLLVAEGMSNLEIGARLYVAETTVKTHVGRILAKLQLRDRVQAVVLAYETGMVRPEP